MSTNIRKIFIKNGCDPSQPQPHKDKKNHFDSISNKNRIVFVRTMLHQINFRTCEFSK